MNKNQDTGECIRCEGSGTHKQWKLRTIDGYVEWEEVTCQKCEGSGVSDKGITWHEIDWDTAEFDGLSMADAPDYCDAYISVADFKDGDALTDKQLESLDDQMVSEALWENMH
jgi:hypothetical protein